jgi:hypothetical protein
MKLTGECFCGEVKYEINGKLSDARSCHCSRCRKAFSSQASAYALVDPSEFQWVSGAECLISYVGNTVSVYSFARNVVLLYVVFTKVKFTE